MRRDLRQHIRSIHDLQRHIRSIPRVGSFCLRAMRLFGDNEQFVEGACDSREEGVSCSVTCCSLNDISTDIGVRMQEQVHNEKCVESSSPLCLCTKAVSVRSMSKALSSVIGWQSTRCGTSRSIWIATSSMRITAFHLFLHQSLLLPPHPHRVPLRFSATTRVIAAAETRECHSQTYSLALRQNCASLSHSTYLQRRRFGQPLSTPNEST
jgi:hypothetical protein